MITYRMAEIGVERVESESSTFIPPDPRHPAWREFQSWCNAGNEAQSIGSRPFLAQCPERKNLWIIGAGGYGREIFSMTAGAKGIDYDWKVAGFLNDIPDSLDEFPDLPRIAGDTTYQPLPNDVFICAIGDVTGRRKVVEAFKGRGAGFINLIQNTATLSPSAQLGEGIIIEPYSGIGANARIGSFATILAHVLISHDVVIGEFAQISPFACILGRASIGTGAFIASHAVVLPGIEVGAGATVGAGSVVIQNVPEGATVLGVPARRIN